MLPNLEKFPFFRSLDELVEFFDTNDMGGYEENLPEAHFEVDLRKKTHTFTVVEEMTD